MNQKRKIVIGTVVAVGVAAAVGIGVNAATDESGDDTDTPISGPALATASAAALADTGGGRVTGTEVGDEDSYFEVEVTLDDGSQVDVQLDEAFSVVSSAVDAETRSDQD